MPGVQLHGSRYPMISAVDAPYVSKNDNRQVISDFKVKPLANLPFRYHFWSLVAIVRLETAFN